VQDEAKAAKAATQPAKSKKQMEEEEVDPTVTLSPIPSNCLFYLLRPCVQKYTENRYKQINDIKAAGKNPYPHKFPTDYSIPEYISKFGTAVGDGEQLGEQVSVAGRVMNYRASSQKLIFLDINGDGEKIQVGIDATQLVASYLPTSILATICSSSTPACPTHSLPHSRSPCLCVCQVMADFKQFDGANDSMQELAAKAEEEPFNYKLGMIKRGDIIGIRGFPGKSKKGELSIFPVSVELLAPCMHMMPRALTNQETRYRQRYLDLILNPTNRNVFVTRSRMIQYVRSFLDNMGFIEVDELFNAL